MKAGIKLSNLPQVLRRLVANPLPAAAVVGLLLLAPATPALAANPTFAIVGPAEWDLPIVPSANVFIQTGVAQLNNRAYDANGHTVDTPVSHTYIGISRFAHLWTFKSLPHVGFFWEALLPEVRVEGPQTGISGIGDPLFDIAAYIRPSPKDAPLQTLFGFQNIVSVPVGMSQVTNNFWEEFPTIITDETYGKLGFDATLGAGIPTDRHKSGEPDQSIGNMYFVEATLRYQALPWLAPFIQYNYQINEPGRIYQANPIYVPGSHENVFGGGVKVNFTPGRWLDIWYNSGISGLNTLQTKALYLRFVNVF